MAACPHNDLDAQLWRRRGAACRSLPLACGCRDPWPCQCDDPPPPLAERMIDAGRAAALHILELGVTPILKIDTLRGLWRRGGTDRELAQHLHTLTTGGEAAA